MLNKIINFIFKKNLSLDSLYNYTFNFMGKDFIKGKNFNFSVMDRKMVDDNGFVIRYANCDLEFDKVYRKDNKFIGVKNNLHYVLSDDGFPLTHGEHEEFLDTNSEQIAFQDSIYYDMNKQKTFYKPNLDYPQNIISDSMISALHEDQTMTPDEIEDDIKTYTKRYVTITDETGVITADFLCVEVLGGTFFLVVDEHYETNLKEIGSFHDIIYENGLFYGISGSSEHALNQKTGHKLLKKEDDKNA